MSDSPAPYIADMSREALQEEVERLRWLIDANPQVPWSADAEGNITDFSQRWLDLTGLTREQALGGGWVSAPHPDDLPAMVEAWTRAVSTGEPYDVRHRIRVADGSHRWMRSWAVPRRGPSGEVLAWFGSTEDVHDATVQTERLYATADALPAMVFHVDTDEVYRFANKNVEATFGRPRSEILGRTIREMVGEGTYADVLPHLLKALSGERTGWAMWVEFPTGRRFTRATYVPSLGAGGEVAGIDVLAVDETEARLTEEALRASEARQRFLAELGEATAEIEGAEEIMLLVADTLGRHMGVSRCSYGLFEEDQDTCVIPGGLNDGVEPIVGAFRLSSFGPEMAARTRLGLPSVVRDVRLEIDSPEAQAAYESIHTRSYVLMPLLRGGRLVALMSVDHKETRDWAPEEVELVRTVTDRSWGYVERARAERALRRSAETFESLVQNSPFGVYVVDADFRLALVSQGAQKVFQNVRPLIGRDFAEVLRAIWEEPFASEAIGVFRGVLETGEPFHSPRTVESRFDVEDVESYDWRVERIAMPDGRLAAVCHFYDLSERLRYEAALQDAKTRTDAILVSADVATWVLDVQNDRLYADRNLARFFDLDEATANGGPAAAYVAKIHPDDQARVARELGVSITEGLPYDIEYRIVAKGAERWVTARGIPERDDEGRIARLPGVVVDVTQLKAAQERERRAAEALRETNESLERRVAERTEDLTRANRDLDQFAYSVAHDLRAPLRAIVSTSRILMEDEGERLTQEGRDALERQAGNAVRLAKIVDDLLGFARLADAEPKKVSFDMTTLARRVGEEVASQRSGCAVAVQEGMRAVGDPSLVGYVLTNLLDNACKFSPGGGVVTVGDQDGAFFVRDQGLGFDPRHAHKLFVAFERLVGQEIEGTGVGLANVRRIVEKHGGRVWAESEPGKGATFWFTLG